MWAACILGLNGPWLAVETTQRSGMGRISVQHAGMDTGQGGPQELRVAGIGWTQLRSFCLLVCVRRMLFIRFLMPSGGFQMYASD